MFKYTKPTRNKKLSCRREAAQCFVSLNILMSLKVADVSPYSYSIVTMYLSYIVSETFNVEKRRHLEFWVRSHSKSLEIVVLLESLGTVSY